jgi:tetratricopeptide (TPR) repeat protein
LGNTAIADELFQRSLDIYIKLFGENSIKLANIYNNIGDVYGQQGRLEQALDMYTRCLNIQKIHYLGNSVSLADTYNNIGKVYR